MARKIWKGNPAIAGLLVSIASIKPNQGNARRHQNRDIAATAASFAEHGQQEPVVLSQDGTLVAGEGRWLAAQTLGWTHIAATRSGLDAGGDHLYAIRDNRTAELSEWDLRKLAARLQALAKTVDLAATGLWAQHELAPFLNASLHKTMTIAVTKEQREIFDRVLEKLRETSDEADADAAVRAVSAAYLTQQEEGG